MFAEDKLDLILRRRREIEEKLSSGPDSQSFVQLSRELAGLEEVTAAIEGFRSAQNELTGLDSLIGDPSTDEEMRALAQGRARVRAAKARDRERSSENRVAPQGLRR